MLNHLNSFCSPVAALFLALAVVAERGPIPAEQAGDPSDARRSPPAASDEKRGTEESDSKTKDKDGPAKKETFKAQHELWTRVLREHVTPEGWIDYRKLRRETRSQLDAYLRQIAGTDLRSLSSRDERVAFWINAYNAICVRTLIAHDLPKEVPHAVLFGKNIFTEETYRVAGKVRSLDEIEHQILRKKYKDPRVHAALVCGASSCPRLRPEAYEAPILSKQLDEETRRWVQSGKDLKGKRKNYLDRSRKTMYVSKIFDWFEEDFGGNDRGVLAFVRRYASDEDRKFLESNRVRVRYLAYDWSLNQRP